MYMNLILLLESMLKGVHFFIYVFVNFLQNYGNQGFAVFMQFPYSKQNGILKYFYNKDSKYYLNSITIFSAGEASNLVTSNAFDFGSSSYWMVSEDKRKEESENYIGFCFKTGKATLIGYEFLTSSGEARPYIWSMSGSNDRIHWRGNTTVEHKMEKSQTYFSPWSKGTFRCFRFDMLRNVYQSFDRGIDIKQIEVFGTYYLTDPEFKKCSKIKRELSNFNFIMFLVLQ